MLTSPPNLAVASLLVLTLTSCGDRTVTQAASPPQPAPAVVTAAAIRRTVPLYREYVGRTEANLSVDVRPQVSGILLEAPFPQGAPVNKGEVLFRIDPSQYRAA